MVSLEDLLCTLIVDAQEVFDLCTSNVPEAYMNRYIPKDKILLINIRGGGGINIICKVNPECEQHVRYGIGGKVLFILIFREIFGCIESVLLWYNLFSTIIDILGFEMNPYDSCVANKVIEGTQYTIPWYVDEKSYCIKIQR